MKQDLTLRGPFGELHGVIHKCPDGVAKGNVLLMAHGFRGSMDGGGRASQLAEEISESLCTVVRFNFTWCTGISNQVAELKAVMDYVRETLNPEKLFLLGRSFGGATCIITACGDEKYRPDGMVLWSAPNSLQKTFIQVLGEDSFNRALQGEAVVLDDERGKDVIPAAFVRDLLKYDLGKLLCNWQAGPLLIIHGEKDCIVSPEQAEQNFSLAGGVKELHYMPGDDHHLSLHWKEAGALIKKWLAEFK